MSCNVSISVLKHLNYLMSLVYFYPKVHLHPAFYCMEIHKHLLPYLSTPVYLGHEVGLETTPQIAYERRDLARAKRSRRAAAFSVTAGSGTAGGGASSCGGELMADSGADAARRLGQPAI